MSTMFSPLDESTEPFVDDSETTKRYAASGSSSLTQQQQPSLFPIRDVERSSQSTRKTLGPPVVVLQNVSKQYTLAGKHAEAVTALSNITLAPSSEFYPIRRGEFVMIRGPSGGGKTTLLNIIGTIDKPTKGSLSLLGQTVDAKSSDSYLANLRLVKLGFVFQTFNLIATMSAFENVCLPMTLSGKLQEKEYRLRGKELLRMVGLGDRMSHLPSELSGGEQQRTTIARALANEPEVLLLDEPTGDLDTRNTIDIMDLLLDINLRHGTTMVMVTHNPDLECYADRVLYVRDGKFEKQALNYVQSRLDFDEYVHLLNTEK
jgi:putative ABC transport system ATP-binding protein